MGEDKPADRIEHLEPMIFMVRDHRVILDADLARLYGVTTKALNQAVKRNSARFPKDFAFQLTMVEAGSLRSQIPASGSQLIERNRDIQNRSQIVTGSQKHRDSAIGPRVFTEHGALAHLARSLRARYLRHGFQ